MLRKDIEEKFPFLSVVTYGGQEYIGIINNQDSFITSMYIFTDLLSEDEKARFIELGEVWWWESNRMIPINIFLKDDMNPSFSNTEQMAFLILEDEKLTVACPLA